MQPLKIFFLISAVFLGFLGFHTSAQTLPADLFNDPRFTIINEELGRLYILNNKNQELVVLDIKTRFLIKKIKLEAGESSAMVRDGKNDKIYISHLLSDKISVIKENDIKKENYQPGLIQRIKNPIALAVDEGRNQIYVASAFNEGSVFVIDGLSDSIKTVWPLGFRPLRLVSNSRDEKLYAIGESKEDFGAIEIKTGRFQKIFAEQRSFLTAEFNEAENRLYLLDLINKELIVLDGFSDKILAKIKAGSDPRQMTVSRELRRIYISNFLSQNIIVVDAKTFSVVQTISLPAGAYPIEVSVNHLSGKLYVSAIDYNRIIVIDAATNKIIKEIGSGGRHPRYGSVNLKTNEIYFLNPESNNLVIIDGATDSQAAILPVQAQINGPIFAGPDNIKFDDTKNLVYVLNNLNGTLTVIDAKTDEPVKVVSVCQNPRAVGLTDKKLYITCADDDSVTILSRQNFSVLKTLKVGSKPAALAVNKKNNKVFVLNHNSGTLSVIDAKTDLLIKELQLDSKITIRFQYSSVTGRIYIPDLINNRVLVIDSDKDEIIKELAVGDLSSGFYLWTAPSDPKIYINSVSEGKISVIRESDYQILNIISVPPYAVVSLFSFRNWLYIAKEGGFIDIVNDEDGKLLKTVSLDGNAKISSILAVPAAGVLPGGRLLALDKTFGRFYIYDLDNDKILSILPAGRGAMGPFMNFKTGKAYIANFRDDSVSVFNIQEGKLLATITNQTPLAPFVLESPFLKVLYYLAALIVLGIIIFLIFYFRKKSAPATIIK